MKDYEITEIMTEQHPNTCLMLAPFFSLVGCGQEFHADFAQKFDTVIRFTKKITKAAKVNQKATKVKQKGTDRLKSN